MLSCHQLFSETSCPNTTMLIYHTECIHFQVVCHFRFKPKKELQFVIQHEARRERSLIQNVIVSTCRGQFEIIENTYNSRSVEKFF